MKVAHNKSLQKIFDSSSMFVAEKIGVASIAAEIRLFVSVVEN